MDEDTRRLTRAVVVRVEEVEKVMVGSMDSEGSTHEFNTDGGLMKKKILREERERERLTVIQEGAREMVLLAE